VVFVDILRLCLLKTCVNTLTSQSSGPGSALGPHFGLLRLRCRLCIVRHSSHCTLTSIRLVYFLLFHNLLVNIYPIFLLLIHSLLYLEPLLCTQIKSLASVPTLSLNRFYSALFHISHCLAFAAPTNISRFTREAPYRGSVAFV
jgi:hypothetical protein